MSGNPSNCSKLPPLIPKPVGSLVCPNNINPLPCYCCTNTNLLALNHHLAEKTELGVDQPLASSRWNPTPEQLLALEELYRRGTRTPTAAQIQQIATRLRRFGKIEGKNVFYWFQNHKARERQKRRREIETNNSNPEQLRGSLDKKESGLMRRTGYEVEQTKNSAPSSNCSKLSEQFVSISMHGAAATTTAESGPNGWMQFQQRELQQRRTTVDTRNATRQRQTMELSYSPVYFIHTMNAAQNFSSLSKPTQENLIISSNLDEEEHREDQTLELFPLRSYDCSINIGAKKDTQAPITTLNSNLTPNHYFEFLPLKN